MEFPDRLAKGSQRRTGLHVKAPDCLSERFHPRLGKFSLSPQQRQKPTKSIGDSRRATPNYTQQNNQDDRKNLYINRHKIARLLRISINIDNFLKWAI
jgi:hypothetical protein